jgi:hypothetical protein
MRIYVSGPIKGKEHGNREAFQVAAVRIRALGHEPITPFGVEDEDPQDDAGCAQCMRCDLRAELECDAIYLLEEWESSSGARVEFMVAQACGLLIIYEYPNMGIPSC